MFFNSQDPHYKQPFGAVPCGERVTFTLRVPCDYGCTEPRLLFGKDGEQPSMFCMTAQGKCKGCHVFTISLEPQSVGLYFYWFDLYVDYQKIYCGQLGEGYVSRESGPAWQLTVYEHDFDTPHHLRGGVLYQIFPDRFCEGKRNKPMPFADRIYRADKTGQPYFWPTEQREGYLNMDYFGGDFAGIMEKLPYLADLGVSCIYLNPIFEAHANHRYNTANYLRADPLLGTNEEFSALCHAAKGEGIDIILDGVFSHTGSDPLYFNRESRYNTPGAYRNPDSPYRSWYDFSPAYPCGYRSWWGFDSLPEVNEEDPSFRAFICGEGGVIDTWLNLGASGFRLDVADELPDAFIEDIRCAIKRHGSEKYLLGEVWEDATNKFSYGSRRTYLLGNGLDSVMNYPFKEAVLAFLLGRDAHDTASDIMQICENYPAPALHTLMNFMSTHDTVRAITALAGTPVDGHDRYWQSEHQLTAQQFHKGRRLMALAYAMIFTLPGLPCIYYGDEVYMQGYKDPFNRAYFNWASQATKLKDELRTLAATRKHCAAFADGMLTITYAAGGVLCYQRTSGAHSAAICINRTDANASVRLLHEDVVVEPWSYELRTK